MATTTADKFKALGEWHQLSDEEKEKIKNEEE